MDAITPSHSVDTAEGGAIGGVVLADNADELLTLPPETESDAVDADSEHSSIALDACEENADATSQCHYYSVCVKPRSKNPVAIFSERGHSSSIWTKGAGAGVRVPVRLGHFMGFNTLNWNSKWNI